MVDKRTGIISFRSLPALLVFVVIERLLPILITGGGNVNERL